MGQAHSGTSRDPPRGDRGLRAWMGLSLLKRWTMAWGFPEAGRCAKHALVRNLSTEGVSHG